MTMPQSQFDSPCEASNSKNNTDRNSSSLNNNYNNNTDNDNNHLMRDQKFAALTAVLNDMLIDDETSPSDSLISSTASDDLCTKQKAKKQNQTIDTIVMKDDGDEKDININDVSPIFEVASPISHGTPTHATNSFSFSDGDGNRDFLIDDEIADQPDHLLCFGDNHGNPNDSLLDRCTVPFFGVGN